MPKLSENGRAFIEDNKTSAVVYGELIAPGEGARYRLENGRQYALTLEDCLVIGMPRWALTGRTEL